MRIFSCFFLIFFCLLASAHATGLPVSCPEGSVPGCDNVCGSNEVFDGCGVCGGNEEARGCDGVCFSTVTVDECGICGGPGPGPCGCDRSLRPDSCGVCGGPGPGECGCNRSRVKDTCGVCGGDGSSCLIGPCEADISSVKFSGQKHDGVRVEFNGANAIHQADHNLFYQQLRDGTIVGCIPNPNTQGLINTSNSGGNVQLFRDYQWFGRASDRVGTLGQRLNQVIDSNSCFLCANVRRSGGCYPPETLLLTAEGSTIRAADVSAGDMLRNPVTGSSVEVLQVIEGPEELPLIGISYNGGFIRISQDHPILTANGSKPARLVTLQDDLFDARGNKQPVTAIEVLPVDEGQRVINFILNSHSADESDHMLVADGVMAGDLILQWMLKERFSE